MTKYFVFRNQTNGEQKNVPGSREEMACDIAALIGQDELPKEFYIAFAEESKHTVLETLREIARCSVEIDDESEKIWTTEAKDLGSHFKTIDDQISEAYAIMYGAASDVAQAIERSEYFKDIEYLGPKTVERTFEYIDSSGLSNFVERVEEIFKVEFFHHHHA